MNTCTQTLPLGASSCRQILKIDEVTTGVSLSTGTMAITKCWGGKLPIRNFALRLTSNLLQVSMGFEPSEQKLYAYTLKKLLVYILTAQWS
jgi:hypothetical protein